MSPVNNGGLHPEDLSGTLLPVMLANSNAVTASKARKMSQKQRRRNEDSAGPLCADRSLAHANETSYVRWAGKNRKSTDVALGYTECGCKFNISPHAIMMRAKRHGWAVPSKIAKRVEALQKSVTGRAVCERNRACNDQAVQVIAESWAERGEAHRALALAAFLAFENKRRHALETGRLADQ